MRKDNRGFSLVELIIVIAIMAVLIGLLAPQYLRFVNRSRIVADIENAEHIARTIDTTIAETPVGTIVGTISGVGNTDISSYNIKGLSKLPMSKLNASNSWSITIGSDGVTAITLGGKSIYPGSPDQVAYYADQYY